jgi:hypothetical protein
LKEVRENFTTSRVGQRKPTDDFQNYCFRKDLQKHIWNLNSKNKYFTLDSLLEYVKADLDYKGGRTTIWKILKSMGCKHKITNDRKILCEKRYVFVAKIKK